MKVFVFGSNIVGHHGAGAAAFAVKNHGALYGQGVGRQGNSYGIPTKDEAIRTLPTWAIHLFVLHFLEYARNNVHEEFEVTRIGCGLAGYEDADIAPMFIGAPSNCHFYQEWTPWLPVKQCTMGVSPA